jgi:hypothetical protein
LNRKPLRFWARISALRGCGEILGIETLVTGRGATNISAGALTVIQRSLKRSNCEAFEVSDFLTFPAVVLEPAVPNGRERVRWRQRRWSID